MPRKRSNIRYPTFVLNGNLIHFAGYQNHIGLYPGSKAIEEFKDELSGYKTSKGTVQFPLDKPNAAWVDKQDHEILCEAKSGEDTKRHKGADNDFANFVALFAANRP